jgi:hypothetical protein
VLDLFATEDERKHPGLDKLRKKPERTAKSHKGALQGLKAALILRRLRHD